MVAKEESFFFLHASENVRFLPQKNSSLKKKYSVIFHPHVSLNHQIYIFFYTLKELFL